MTRGANHVKDIADGWRGDHKNIG
jgi:hypothetical protein